MTIISLKHNRYNLVTQRMNWQKKNSKVLNSRFSFVAFLNIGLMILIIFTIVGSLFLEIKMVNYRFDIKNLTSQSVVFEQKNAELKNQVASLQSFDKFTAIAEKEGLILVAVPGYFLWLKIHKWRLV